jgi:hypothetical protein
VVILYSLWSYGIGCGHLVYFEANMYIGIFSGHLYSLWSYGIVCGHLV